MRLHLQTEKANSLKIPDGTAIPCEYIGQYFLFNDIIMKLIFCILKSFAFICLNNSYALIIRISVILLEIFEKYAYIAE